MVANADGSATKELAQQGALISTLCWLDNNRLVTANEAQELRIIRVDNQVPDEVFRLHPARISELSVGMNGQIASVAQGESVQVWSPSEEAAEHLTLAGARLPHKVAACVWHPQSNVLGLVSQQQATTVAATWSPGATQVENIPLTNGASSVHWHQSGDALIVEATDGSWKTVPWPLPVSTKPIVTTQRIGPLYSFGGRFRLDSQIFSGQNAIVDTHEKQAPIDPKVQLVAYAWHPSETWLAVADIGVIRLCNPLWDRSAWVATPWSDQIHVTLSSLAWSRDGKYLLAGSNSGVLYILDGATLEKVRTLHGHAGAITTVAASHDGTRIVSAGIDGFMRWWDAERGVELFKFPITKSDGICELHFSADGQWLAGRSVSGQVHVWTTDRQVTTRIVNTPPVVNAATSPTVKAEPTIDALTAMITANPQDSDALAQRGKLHHRWHRWDQAADDFERLLQLDPNNLWRRQDAAITSLAVGREKDYFRHCHEIETQLSKLTAPDILHTRAARILSLRPDGFVEGEKLLNMAVKMAEKEPTNRYIVHPQIPLLFRLKRFEGALQEARRIPRESLSGDGCTLAPLHAWESMILWQLNRRQEAREALTLARWYIKDAQSSRGQPWGDSDEIIEAEIVIREAEALVTAEEK